MTRAPGVCTAAVRVLCPDEATAANVLAALAPENGDWVDGRVEGRTLVLDVAADSPASLRRALEDALACATMALRATDAVDPEG